MRRFFIWLGVFLMVFAFVVLFIFIILPALVPSFDSVPPLKSTFQLVFCRPDETLVDGRSTYSTPGTTVTTLRLACMDQAENQRDISDDRISVGMFGYLVPFLVGLFMALLAFNSQQPNQRSGNNRRKPTASGSKAPSKDSEKNVESATERLKELKSALDLGFITQAEYDAKRKEILRDM